MCLSAQLSAVEPGHWTEGSSATLVSVSGSGIMTQMTHTLFIYYTDEKHRWVEHCARLCLKQCNGKTKSGSQEGFADSWTAIAGREQKVSFAA